MTAPRVVLFGGTTAIKAVAKVYYRGLRLLGAEVVALPYGGFMRIGDTYQVLAPRLENRLGDDPAVVIGHSQGGLLAAQYAMEHANVLRVIGLSAPFHGTLSGYLAPWIPAVRDMLPGSRYLAQLNERLPELAGRLASYFVHGDLLIRPFDSPYVEGAINKLIAPAHHWPKLRHLDVELHEGRFNHVTEVKAEVLANDLRLLTAAA